jgi:hypothetical protein
MIFVKNLDNLSISQIIVDNLYKMAMTEESKPGR